MAVPEQTPYIEHTGNGVTTSFALKFQCESKDHLIVLIDDIEPPIATWSLTGGNVVFTTAPAAGKKITLQRNTPFSRTVDYQSYNNSFRPPAVNKDFDWIWLKLQELGVADWILSNRIDALKNYVDDRDDELRAYLMEEIRKQGVALDQLDEYYNYLMERLAQIAVDKGWDSSFVVHKGQTQYEINEDFFNKKWEKVSVKDFGAKGNGDQNLYATDYYSDQNKSIRITQQTADGLAFNRAIKWLRNKGGGALYIPEAEQGKSYRIYGYLEQIDFPCVIYGAGAHSWVQNCDNSPTNVDGYGIFCIQPLAVSEITMMNFKLDGNADVRTKPTSELRLYPFVVLGYPQIRLFNLTSINSPIDCLHTRYKNDYELTNGEQLWLKAVNCLFDNSYRNTASLVKGWHQEYVNCDFLRGGYVQGGTQPKYCIDIEPTLASNSIKDINFTNCRFALARNVLVGGVWAAANFVGCTFDASTPHPDDIAKNGYPWAFQMTGGEWSLTGCKIFGRADTLDTICYHYNQYSVGGEFADSGYLRIKDTEMYGCGLQSNGRRIFIENVLAQNSLRPFVFERGAASPQVDVNIKNLRLVNVFDNSNAGTGTTASFAVKTNVNGIIDIDGVTVEVDPTSLAKMPKELFTQSTYHGVYIPDSISSGKRSFVRNIHSEGFYKRLPSHLGVPENSGNFRDWGQPNLPPADTAVLTAGVTATLTDGTVANNTVTNKAVTGSATQNSDAANRILGGRTKTYWKNCTMWGNYS